MYRIVNTDNFGGDYPNESFTDDGPFETVEAAQQRADELNTDDPNAPRFFMVVTDGYELLPGFEP